jgi:allantoinase
MNEPLDLIFRAPRVITAAGEVARSIGVRDGRIVAIEQLDSALEADRIVELGTDEVLIPGLVDTHVHVNDPGRTEWEGFASATRAAAAGGVTTIVDMPLNSIPPTVDTDALDIKRKTAAEQAYVDVGFWGGAIPGNVPQLRALHDAGVFGFKCFLLHSGVDEFPPLNPIQLEEALREIASFGALMIVHAEDAHSIDRAPSPNGERYADFLASRPRGAENLAIAEVIELARWTGCRVHILHLSSSDALPMIASARRALDGGDPSALLVVHGRGNSRRGNSIQVLPADQGSRQPRVVVARARRGHHRLHRLRSLAVHRRIEAVRHRRLRCRLGRHRVAAIGLVRRLDRGPPSWPHPA